MPQKMTRSSADYLFRREVGSRPESMGVVDGPNPFDNCEPEGIWWATCLSKVAGMDGYVRIPDQGHPWSRNIPSVYELNGRLMVHRGIQGRADSWLRFSTCHPGDVWSYEYDPMGFTRRFSKMDPIRQQWTQAKVERECVNLARQVYAIGVEYRKSQDTVNWVARMTRFQHLDIAE